MMRLLGEQVAPSGKWMSLAPAQPPYLLPAPAKLVDIAGIVCVTGLRHSQTQSSHLRRHIPS